MKFTAIIQLMSNDIVHLKESLYDTRFNLMKKTLGQDRNSYYYAHCFGETKNKAIADELDGELSSLGCYPIEIDIYWGV